MANINFINTQLQDLQKRFLRQWSIMRDGFLDTGTIEEMLDDPTVQLAEAYLTYPITQQPWAIECENEKIAEFLTEQMTRHHRQIHKLCLKVALPFGNAAAENVWAKDGIYLIIDRILEEVNDGAEIVVDDDGNFLGLRLSGTTEIAPPWKVLWFVWDYSYNNPYGRQILKPAYVHWFAKLLFQTYQVRYFERKAIPPPVVKYPKNVQVHPTTGVSTEVNRSAAESVVANMNGDSGIVVEQPQLNPDGSQPLGWEVSELQIDNTSDSFDEPIQQRAKEIMRAHLIPDRLITSDSNGGMVFGDEEIQKTLFFYVLGDIMGYAEGSIKCQFLDPLRIINFGENSPPAFLKYSPLVDARRKLFEKMFEYMLQTKQASVDMVKVFEELAIDGDIAMPPVVSASPNPTFSNQSIKKKRIL